MSSSPIFPTVASWATSTFDSLISIYGMVSDVDLLSNISASHSTAVEEFSAPSAMWTSPR